MPHYSTAKVAPFNKQNFLQELCLRHGKEAIVFLAGTARDSTNPGDVDVVVLFNSVRCTSRFIWEYDGLVVDEYRHDFETLLYSIRSEARQAISATARMIIDSELHFGDHVLANEVRMQVRKIVEAGPSPLDPTDLRRRLYCLTKSLKRSRSHKDNISISLDIQDVFRRFYFHSMRLWGGGANKYFRRELERKFPDLASALDEALKAVWEDNVTTKLQIVIQGWIENLVGLDSEILPYFREFDSSHRIRVSV